MFIAKAESDMYNTEPKLYGSYLFDISPTHFAVNTEPCTGHLMCEFACCIVGELAPNCVMLYNFLLLMTRTTEQRAVWTLSYLKRFFFQEF
jgi:hypothetical protein